MTPAAGGPLLVRQMGVGRGPCCVRWSELERDLSVAWGWRWGKVVRWGVTAGAGTPSCPSAFEATVVFSQGTKAVVEAGGFTW